MGSLRPYPNPHRQARAIHAWLPSLVPSRKFYSDENSVAIEQLLLADDPVAWAKTPPLYRWIIVLPGKLINSIGYPDRLDWTVHFDIFVLQLHVDLDRLWHYKSPLPRPYLNPWPPT